MNITKIHIDGHPDTATPEEFDELNKLTNELLLSPDLPPEISLSENILLPLMQSNDVFILSAVLTGLVNRIIWVTPNWHRFNISLINKNYIGWINLNESKKSYCVCEAFVFKKYLTNYTCSYMSRISESPVTVKIPSNECHRLKEFSFLIVNEEKFEKLRLKSINNFFVDIDEDFFGVESGVQAFIDKGLSLELHNYLNKQLPKIICPLSIAEETYADEAIRSMFKNIVKMKKSGLKDNFILSVLKRDLIELSKKYNCIGIDPNTENKLLTIESTIDTVLGNVSFLIYQKSNFELEALGSVRYCLSTSPAFMLEPVFGICSGNIYPGDILNQIYVGSNLEIEQRGERLTSILKKINSNGFLKFVSVARSLRDGYTPRKQQRAIENVIRKSLEEAASSCDKKIKLKYDKHLVFGKEGWTLQ